MTDTNTNTKKTVQSKAHPKVTATLKQALLEFQKLAVTAKRLTTFMSVIWKLNQK